MHRFGNVAHFPKPSLSPISPQRKAAFAAIRLLYGEALPLWRFGRKGYCRRHKQCSGEIRPCLKRGWPLMPPALQKEACAQVAVGGPRRLPPSTHTEWMLRRYAPSTSLLEGRWARIS